MKDKKSVKLFSCIHEDLRSLGSDVESIFGDNDDRIVNDKTLYSYYNMRPTLSDEEKENMSREELINFGDSYALAQMFIVPVESMVLNTNSLPKVRFDTNKLERDVELSNVASKLMSEIVFNANNKFQTFWRSQAGWGFFRAGGSAIWDYGDVGLYPRFADTLYYPTGSSLNPDEMTRAVEELNYDIHDLEDIYDRTSDNDEEVDKETIKE